MEKARRLLSAMMREVRTSQLNDALQENTSSLVTTCRPIEQEYSGDTNVSCFRDANTKFASMLSRQCDWISSATEAENELKITSASHLKTALLLT